MTVVCPSGHNSESEDYCDICGIRIGGAAPATPPGAPGAGAPSPAAQAEPCPACGAARAGDDRFCEGCGYDFVAGAPVQSADWVAVAAADQDQFDSNAPEGLTFPVAPAERRFPLTVAAIRIGRGRHGPDGQAPEIDLGVPPEDPGVSHMHAVLRRRDDGSYAVCDLGSTNGTTINDDSQPLTAGVEVALADGDVIRIGAWTKITIRRTTP